MKISYADNDKLKPKKDPLEKYFSVFQYKFCARCYHFYVDHEIYFYVFYIPKQKNIKVWHFRNVTFMVYIIIKA